ncbi:MAG: CapA family protein, partial [Spirochaetota bacterium]
SHPHVIQPFEIYNDKLILYSCANLISGQAYNIGSKEETDFHQNYFYTRAVPIIRVFFGKDKKLVRIELIPFFQLNNFFVRSKMESYFTTLIPTKYFVNDLDNPSQKIFFNYFQKDELSEISQDAQNKGEKLYFFEYIKNNLLDKKTIKNIILANNILYNTFFYNYLDKDNEDEIKNYDNILKTEDSYIFER